jgi:hypothetical protein
MSIRSVGTCFLLAAAHRTLAAQAPAPSVRDSIQYRFADSAGRASGHRYSDPLTVQVYVLSDTVVLNGYGIDSVEVRSRRVGGDTTVDVVARLQPSAAGVFSTATASHIGRVLVVTIGDRIVATGMIQSRLGSVVPVMSGVARSTAEALAMRINAPANGATKGP